MCSSDLKEGNDLAGHLPYGCRRVLLSLLHGGRLCRLFRLSSVLTAHEQRGVHRIALGAIGIRLCHPCRLALGRTIQQDFLSSHFQMMIVSPFAGRKSVNEFRTIFQIHVSYYIQPQTVLFIQHGIDAFDLLHKHPFLNSGNTF